MHHHKAVQRPAAAAVPSVAASPLTHINPAAAAARCAAATLMRCSPPATARRPTLLSLRSVRATAAAPIPHSGSSSDGSSLSPLSSSWEQPSSLRDSMARLQQRQQHRQLTLPPQLHLQPPAPGSRSGEESDLLWAGYRCFWLECWCVAGIWIACMHAPAAFWWSMAGHAHPRLACVCC